MHFQTGHKQKYSLTFSYQIFHREIIAVESVPSHIIIFAFSQDLSPAWISGKRSLNSLGAQNSSEVIYSLSFISRNRFQTVTGYIKNLAIHFSLPSFRENKIFQSFNNYKNMMTQETLQNILDCIDIHIFQSCRLQTQLCQIGVGRMGSPVDLKEREHLFPNLSNAFLCISTGKMDMIELMYM